MAAALCNDVLRQILHHVAHRAPDYLWDRLLHVLLGPRSCSHIDTDLVTMCRSIMRPLSFIVCTPVAVNPIEVCLPFDCSSNVSFVVDWGDHTTSRLDIHGNIMHEQPITYNRLKAHRVSHSYSSLSSTHDYSQFSVRVFRLPQLQISSTIHFGHYSEPSRDHDYRYGRHYIYRIISIGNIGVESLEGLFMHYFRCVTFEASLNLSNIKNMARMFCGARWFNDHNVRYWNVCNVTDMRHMFAGTVEVNAPIGGWNVANVRDMSSMFEYTHAFNQPIGRWNVSNVTNMASMFHCAHVFNQPIGDWNVANVQNMSSMFARAYKFNQYIGDWNVGNVKNMSSMFSVALAFDQPVGRWNVSSVTDMNRMFLTAQAFNQPIGDWTVACVTNMSHMFDGACAFNQPIGQWDVSNVTNMAYMFFAANAFNQPITQWDVRNVREKNHMFSPRLLLNFSPGLLLNNN